MLEADNSPQGDKAWAGPVQDTSRSEQVKNESPGGRGVYFVQD